MKLLVALYYYAFLRPLAMFMWRVTGDAVRSDVFVLRALPRSSRGRVKERVVNYYYLIGEPVYAEEIENVC